MTVHTKALVIDVDDTISTHHNRDYANAIPNMKMIEKINRLYMDGWWITYFTARGAVSCNNNLNLIEETRGPVLRNWMSRHGVMYNELKFGKPIAVYYIDDKALRPDEFLKMKIETLKGGSGAEIERMGDRVIKKHPKAEQQAKWYLDASDFFPVFDVPKVNTCYDNTLDMEFIEGISFNDAVPEFAVEIKNLLNEFSSAVGNDCNWDTMVNRVHAHAKENAFPHDTEILKLIDKPHIHRFMNTNKSFSHGDLTFENMIIRAKDGKLVLIDPNYEANLYSSWIMDAGKILQSCVYDYEGVFYDRPRHKNKRAFKESFLMGSGYTNEQRMYMHIAHLIHWIKMIKYKSENDKKLVRDYIDAIYTTLIEDYNT